MKTLSEIIKINLPKISLLDVGAMKTNEPDRYESLFKSNLIEVIGFEANLSEYIKLKNKKNEKYLNYCLGDGTEKTLYVTNYPGCTSLYESSPDIINLFTGIGTDDGNFTVIEKRKIKTHKLKEIKEINKVDVIKIDTQGSELDILKNFEKK
jgi:FkbM family methyltransferase